MLAGEGHVTLGYNVDGMHVVTEAVALDRTPCYYGGSRPWFMCPGCDRRCATLYLTGERFRCRLCADLTYVSRQSAAWVRRMRRYDRLRQRLSVVDGQWPPPKPTGMHWTTWLRLVNEYVSASNAASAGLRELTERHKREFGRLYDG